MKINLTKLLDISARIVYVTKPAPGTTADTRYVRQEEPTGGVNPYSFEMNDEEDNKPNCPINNLRGFSR